MCIFRVFTISETDKVSYSPTIPTLLRAAEHFWHSVLENKAVYGLRVGFQRVQMWAIRCKSTQSRERGTKKSKRDPRLFGTENQQYLLQWP